MKIIRKSFFKDSVKDVQWFENWATDIERANHKHYQRFRIETSLGITHVWGLNTDRKDLDSLIIFPGARTSSLFWDLDNGLNNLGVAVKIYLIETNGLPNNSDGDTPDIKSTGYGEWATEILDRLHIEKAFVAGASFGGLVCMKLGMVSPDRIKAAFLLNPGCLQPFSLSFKNLYYNLLPIIFPNRKNVMKFLDSAVFNKPDHKLSAASEKRVIDYELFALTRYKDNTQKPYDMDEQLEQVKVDTYLLLGDKDLLFPFRQSIKNATKKLPRLNDVKVFENVGHGIETHDQALQYIGKTIQHYLDEQKIKNSSVLAKKIKIKSIPIL